MVTRALYRGSAHVCVDADDTFRSQFGDFIGVPIRERFPELTGFGFFEAMDAVYLSGEAVEMPWASLHDGQMGTMLILPWRVDGETVGVGCHFHPYEPDRPATARLPLAVPVSALVAAAALATTFAPI